ncbi:hypothetical protein DQD89_24700 [Salmonella enterica subsp. enterica]|nr:hypothetical protein [Salmonella enterica subsp. enterica serovar Kedougou]
MQPRFTIKVLPLKTQVLDLYGEWMTRENFINEMPVKIRVMRDCIVITPQHTRELFGCIEGMSVTYSFAVLRPVRSYSVCRHTLP